MWKLYSLKLACPSVPSQITMLVTSKRRFPRGHPYLMPEPPQLAPLIVVEQQLDIVILCELLCLYPLSTNSFSHHPKLMTICKIQNEAGVDECRPEIVKAEYCCSGVW